MLPRTKTFIVSYCFGSFLLRHYKHTWPNPPKMSNFRTPAKKLASTLHKAHYSSSSEKVVPELLKQIKDVAEDKAKSEKLNNLLPYLQHRKVEYIPRTSVTDTQPEGTKGMDNKHLECLEKVAPSTVSGEQIVTCNMAESPKVTSESSVVPKVPQDPPQSLPVLMVAQIKTPTVDLTNAMLPLSLHLNDRKSLLVDGVVQDIKDVYFKTSSTLENWYLVARTQGKTLYISVEEIMKRPGVVQYFLLEHVMKNSIAIYDPKLSALANIDVNSIVEKIKQLIENIIGSIKKMFQKESKPTGNEEKKKEEVKTEQNPEKKVEEGEKSQVTK